MLSRVEARLLTVPSLLFLDCSGPVANGTNRIAILSQNVTAAYTFSAMDILICG